MIKLILLICFTLVSTAEKHEEEEGITYDGNLDLMTSKMKEFDFDKFEGLWYQTYSFSRYPACATFKFGTDKQGKKYFIKRGQDFKEIREFVGFYMKYEAIESELFQRRVNLTIPDEAKPGFLKEENEAGEYIVVSTDYQKEALLCYHKILHQGQSGKTNRRPPQTKKSILKCFVLQRAEKLDHMSGVKMQNLLEQQLRQNFVRTPYAGCTYSYLILDYLL